jgi:hypothetical protein
VDIVISTDAVERMTNHGAKIDNPSDSGGVGGEPIELASD